MAKKRVLNGFEYPKNLILSLGMEFIKEDEITDNQLKGMLYCVGTLKSTHKYIIEAYFRDHKTIDEIADKLGISKKAASNEANRALCTLIHPSKVKYLMSSDAILSEFAKIDMTIKYCTAENMKRSELAELDSKLKENYSKNEKYENWLNEICKELEIKSTDLEDIVESLKRYNSFNADDKAFPENLVYAIYGDYGPKQLCKDQVDGLKYVLSMFDERERSMVLLRYRDGLTYDEIGKKCGLSGTRVSQIIAKTLRKCRMPFRGNYIKYGYAVGSGKVTAEIEAKYKEIENAKRKQLAELNTEIDILTQNLNEIRTIIGDKYPLIISKLHSMHRVQVQNGYYSILELYDRGELSVRTRNILIKRFGKDATLKNVADCTEEEVRRWRNTGDKTVVEIHNLLNRYGITFRQE